jgi:mannose-6-phosphate isomerase
MQDTSLYPLRFEPLYQYRPWGGRRLAKLLSRPLPDDRPVGEAWMLSDRNDHSSVVAHGALKGKTISQLSVEYQEQLLGELSGRFSRFPLLLKFLDVSQRLSVQVHPSDAHRALIPAGDRGKTEAWVVLEEGPAARVFAGLQAGVGADTLRRAIASGTSVDLLSGFVPTAGDVVFIPAGVVHSMSDTVVFEVQQNSDVTFRLYDWDRLDPSTGVRRALQVEQAIACIDFAQGPVGPRMPVVRETRPVLREELLACDQFGLTRISGSVPFAVGAAGTPRVLVCLAGSSRLEHVRGSCALNKGEVLLLPAVLGQCCCRPDGMVTVLEMSLPGGDDR